MIDLFLRLSFYPAVHFMSVWLSGIIPIINSNGDCASPRNIPLWIFDSTKLFPPAVNSTFRDFMVSSIKFMTSFDNNNNDNNNNYYYYYYSFFTSVLADGLHSSANFQVLQSL